MPSLKRALVSASLLALALATLAAAAPSTRDGVRGTVRPVIGKPSAVPAQAQPGKRLTVVFKVTRSDTHAPLMHGKMICDPSVAGKMLAHSESFRNGTARLSFLVPVTAEGKTLTVKLTIRYAGASATRLAPFRVASLPKPTVTTDDSSVAEGNSGTTNLVFPVRLSAATPRTVSVQYATVDGTATGGSDFTAGTGKVVFASGQTTASVTVPVTGDTVFERDETLTLRLSAATNATIGDGEAVGTITNDDAAPRSGHYTGSSSQWQFIAFDVDSVATSITGLFFFADLTCDTPLSSLKGVKFWATDPIAVKPGGSFAVDASGTSGLVSIHFLVSGQLTPPSSASGTLRVVDVTSNEPPFRGAHCWTQDVTWNAS